MESYNIIKNVEGNAILVPIAEIWDELVDKGLLCNLSEIEREEFNIIQSFYKSLKRVRDQRPDGFTDFQDSLSLVLDVVKTHLNQNIIPT